MRPPYRPNPNLGRGRPRLEIEEDVLEEVPLPPLTPVERRAFDYTSLEEALTHHGAVVRQTRRVLGVVAAGGNPMGPGRAEEGLEQDAIID